MRILCIGDIVGKPGRKAVTGLLPDYRKQAGLDCVIANAENAAGGSGLTVPLFTKLRNTGVDAVTLGDHVYRNRDVMPLLTNPDEDRVVRPANLAPEAAGRQWTVFEVGGVSVGLFVVLGRLFIKGGDCPFRAAERGLDAIGDKARVVVADIHAEATSEKIALGHHLAGRVSIMFGTHTHVPTADETILADHTAYITDVGMTGPYDSVLGRDKNAVIAAMRTSMPHPFNVAEGDVRLCGVQVDVDESTGAAMSVQRVCLNVPPDAE